VFKSLNLAKFKADQEKIEQEKQAYLESIEFVDVEGLPKIDQAFLDDFEARKPWETFHYKFFYFFRRWPMTILAVTTFLPIIVAMGLRTGGGYEHLFIGLGIVVVLAAIVMDCTFVPKAPDQQLTTKEIYAFFYDENFFEVKKVYCMKQHQTSLKMFGMALIFSIMLIAFAFTISFYELESIWFDSAVLFVVMSSSFYLFYKYPFNPHFSFAAWPDEYLRDKKLLLKSIDTPRSLDLFFIPFGIGIFLFIIGLMFGVLVALGLNLNNPITTVNIEDIFLPAIRYFSFLFISGFLFISMAISISEKYISFAKEILKLKSKKDKVYD